MVDLQLDRAHSARMYDYYLGGRTNFQADREAVARVVALMPAIRIAARENRKFMHRSTRFLAEHGMRQFLDIGTGIPTRPNLHEVAQSVAPEARVLYVDNDPIVLAHAQALLRGDPRGRTEFIQADVRDPRSILDSPVLHRALDLTQPVALSMNAVLHFVTDDEQAHAALERLKALLVPGSAMVISHASREVLPQRTARGSEIYRSAGTSVRPRSRAEFEAFFTGWALVEPGVTTVFRWRPDPADPASGELTDEQAGLHAAVAYKPAG